MATTSSTGCPHNPVDSLTDDPSSWENSPLLSVKQITPGGLELLNRTALSMRDIVRKDGGDERLKHRVLASVFYESSTRTSCSFQCAMLRLGGRVVHVDAGKSGNTSHKKGESLSDTIKCLECYSDVTVLRHPVVGSVAEVIQKVTKPVINAGDGIGEHPTQALLDLFTIREELGLIGASGEDRVLNIVLLGDLKHGRTVHSLAKLLARSGMKVKLRYCAPPSLQMPQDVKDYVSQYDLVQEELSDLRSAVQDADVLYVTRVQRERFTLAEDYEKVKGLYVVDEKLMESSPSKMIVMHPLPRVDEIAEEVDSDPRAAYFRQMENGMFVRMAILSLVLGKP